MNRLLGFFGMGFQSIGRFNLTLLSPLPQASGKLSGGRDHHRGELLTGGAGYGGGGGDGVAVGEERSLAGEGGVGFEIWGFPPGEKTGACACGLHEGVGAGPDTGVWGRGR
jgi:hypothetical protein